MIDLHIGNDSWKYFIKVEQCEYALYFHPHGLSEQEAFDTIDSLSEVMDNLSEEEFIDIHRNLLKEEFEVLDDGIAVCLGEVGKALDSIQGMIGQEEVYVNVYALPTKSDNLYVCFSDYSHAVSESQEYAVEAVKKRDLIAKSQTSDLAGYSLLPIQIKKRPYGEWGSPEQDEVEITQYWKAKLTLVESDVFGRIPCHGEDHAPMNCSKISVDLIDNEDIPHSILLNAGIIRDGSWPAHPTPRKQVRIEILNWDRLIEILTEWADARSYKYITAVRAMR